ncbi:MAG TPA: hydroxyacid dehydrogenase [Acetobacteraceae bacterium]|jgi:D-3-phosphoglycerate dehydrogenase|nr:hydroxyacid dehydrogenase [Acetobacteraceae bacterium]
MAVNLKRLVYFDSFMDPIANAIIGKRDDIDLVRLDYASPEADNWTEFAGAHGYQVQPRGELRAPWFGDAALLARCPNMLAVSSTGAGYDMIDVDACTTSGVIVVNQSGTNFEPVAEHALGLMLSLSKKIALSERAMKRTPDLDRRAYAGNNLRNKTVGIIGIGHIGRRVAELCGALFNMTVLAYDPYLTTEQIAARGATKVELDELLRRADYVTVHCPRSSETFGMFGAAQFAAMKPGVYFINTARGGIHDEPSLAAALTDGRIAGAGLDVFLQEPPPLDHPLLALDNVIASPHIAGMTVETMVEMCEATALQWLTIFDGGVPPRLVNPEAWPRYAARFSELLGFRPADPADAPA